MSELTNSMASIFDTLSSVLDNVPDRYLDFAKEYERRLVESRNKLDHHTNRNGFVASSVDAVAAATEVFCILFGDLVTIPSTIGTASTTSYEDMQQRSWSLNCWLPAACFVRLRNPIDVAVSLVVVEHFSVDFAIRGIGHNTNPGFSSIDGGILLDVRDLNTISLGEGQRTVSVGPGATWNSVYEELQKHELTAVGARAGVVGVGGYTLGGGMSHFSNHWGLACDHVEAFEVVLPGGRIVEASAKENSDLYWALKGGGPNFGIVTRLELRTNSEYKLWHTVKVYSATDAKALTKAAVEINHAMLEDDRLGFIFLVAAKIFTVIMVYRDGTEMPAAFHAFDSIEPMMVAIPETVGTQASAAEALGISGDARREVGIATVGVDAELWLEMHQVLTEVSADIPFSIQFALQPLGPSAVKAMQAKGGNALNVPTVPQVWAGCFAEWQEATQDGTGRMKIRELVAGLEEKARGRGLLYDFIFPNDAGYWQDPLTSFGVDSLAKLQEVASKCDPKGVMQQQKGGFLLKGVRN